MSFQKLSDVVKKLYNDYGQRKPMGISAPSNIYPHFFLLRTFLGDNDLAILFNTKRCQYQCSFCQLPAKSSKEWVSSDDIIAQFEYILMEVKHALSILDRVSISNEGSILDQSTFPNSALLEIADCINELRRARTFVIETRLEFIDIDILAEIRKRAPRVTLDFVTGFETQDIYIRNQILRKRETIETFLSGLDKIAVLGGRVTSYVLLKPDPKMSDKDAFVEADRTIDYLKKECAERDIPLSVRLNPMYPAAGSEWSKLAEQEKNYKPPRLTDILLLAEKKSREGIPVYIGLSTEGLTNNLLSYMSREDFNPELLKQAILFNNKIITSFNLPTN